MTSNQLLEVLGGQDLLVMMCDAKRFSVGEFNYKEASVKFWAGPYIVKLTYSLSDYAGFRYVLDVKHRKTKFNNIVERFNPEDIRKLFEHLTGYTLSF
jgi:hypothetical protein